jgi:AcrR family transcriptional regulator
MNLTKRQQEIISIATRQIAAHGVKKLTIKTIAKELGVTEPALYRHFSNKHEILQTLINCYAEDVNASLDKARKAKTGMDQLQQYLLSREKQYAATPEWGRLSFCEELFYNDEGLAQDILILFNKVRLGLEAMIVRGQEDGSIRQDIPVRGIYLLAFGAHRILLTEWCYNNFQFDYPKEVDSLRDELKIILAPPVKHS